MNVETAISEYAWADDSIEACREALQEYSAGNDILVDVIVDGIVKYAKQLHNAEMKLHKQGYNDETIERMCNELRNS